MGRSWKRCRLPCWAPRQLRPRSPGCPAGLRRQSWPAQGLSVRWRCCMLPASPRAQRRGCVASKSAADPQVCPLDVGTFEQRLGRPLFDDPTRLKNVSAVCHLQRLGRILLDQQDRRSLLVDVANDLENGVNQDGRSPSEGSSSSSNLGRDHIPLPVASLCWSPPGHFPPICRAPPPGPGKQLK